MMRNKKTIIDYLMEYFSRFLIFENVMSCILVVFLFSIIKPKFSSKCIDFLCKYIGKIPWHDYIYNIIVSIVCLVLFGLITFIFKKMCLEIKKYFKTKENEKKKEFDGLYKKYRETGAYIIWLHDLECLAKKNNLYNKVPENLWEEYRVAKRNLKKDFFFSLKKNKNFTSIDQLKEFDRIFHFMVISIKIYELMVNNKK